MKVLLQTHMVGMATSITGRKQNYKRTLSWVSWFTLWIFAEDGSEHATTWRMKHNEKVRHTQVFAVHVSNYFCTYACSLGFFQSMRRIFWHSAAVDVAGTATSKCRSMACFISLSERVKVENTLSS